MARVKTVQDEDSNAIQTLAPDTTRANINALTVGGTAASAQLATTSDVFRLATDADSWIMFGDSGVSAQANDILFPAGVEIFKRPEGATHISCIQFGGSSGTLSVTPMGAE